MTSTGSLASGQRAVFSSASPLPSGASSFSVLNFLPSAFAVCWQRRAGLEKMRVECASRGAGEVYRPRARVRVLAPLLRSCLDAGSDLVRLETLAEGRCVQTLHVGSYDDEGPVLSRLHAFAAESRLALTGKH
ncbi:MAG: hypothetical protein V4750_01915, partial [Pseudomonadota bacterium]